MKAEPSNTFEAATLEEWRQWLQEHHASESEVWLVFRKRRTGRRSIAYGDALDEALCFGWIDSLIRRLDDERYARKFTPRRANSRWSEVNRKRYAELQKSGRLKPPGLERVPTERGYDRRPSTAPALPKYIREAIQSRPKAWRFFQSLAPSYRRMYVVWIDTAKRAETRTRRLAEAVRLLSRGEKLGLK